MARRVKNRIVLNFLWTLYTYEIYKVIQSYPKNIQEKVLLKLKQKKRYINIVFDYVLTR